MNDIGTDIEFAGGTSGNGYKWIASARSDKRDKIIFHKHRVWSKEYKNTINRVIHCLSHEPIHQILWDMGYKESGRTFDIGRKLFLNMLHKQGVSSKELKEIVLGL